MQGVALDLDGERLAWVEQAAGGGVLGWLRTVPLAAARGMEVSTHLYPEVAVHLMCVTETAHWRKWQGWANPILAEPFEGRDGDLVVPYQPGCGVGMRLEPAMRRYALDA